jgi:hypothetical protein
MANIIHARFNLTGMRARPGTVPGVPLKRLNECKIKRMAQFSSVYSHML